MDLDWHESEPGVLLIGIERHLDFRNADDLVDLCRSQIQGGVPGMIVVLKSGAILDSNGLGAIIRVHRSLKQVRGTNPHFSSPHLGIVNHSERARVLLEITGLPKAIPVFPSIERAVRSVSPSKTRKP